MFLLSDSNSENGILCKSLSYTCIAYICTCTLCTQEISSGMRLAFRNAFAFPHAILLSQSNAIRCNGIINKKTYEYHNCCIIDWLCDSCAMCANVRWWRRLRPNSQKSPSIFYFISFYCALPAASFQCLSIDTDFCWSTTNDNI